MNCPNCGTALPANARFCFACGATISGAPSAGTAPPPPPPPSSSGATPARSATAGAAGATAFKCPNCGGPLAPIFGEMVITCDYCGSSVALGQGGWKEINKHTVLAPKVTTAAAALDVVHRFLDTGFFHRKAFEESTVIEQRLSFVPFWVVPVSATTNYVYTDVAVAAGSTIATVAAAELLGSALGGRRGGGFIPIPVMMGSPVNSSRQDTIVGQYEFPVVAVKAMSSYQPKDYEFALADRTFFDKKVIPDGVSVLNGDLGEDAAQHSAKSFVTQLQTEAAHKKHTMVSKLQCTVDVGDPELLHVPIYYYILDRKGAKTTVLIDGHAAQVIRTVGP
ncbi:MAG: zinc ribbon domain-containing protein [Thermoplasmata archaeon]|nr:zinc ribbon domain-containing protein [Thermoplasmata archaeon]